MIKINKSVKLKLHFIIKNVFKIKLMPTLRSKNEAIFFFNFQQMFAQLVIYLDLSNFSYHSSRTFKFINIFSYYKCVFVLEPQFLLNQLELYSINTMYSLIIEKYSN